MLNQKKTIKKGNARFDVKSIKNKGRITSRRVVHIAEDLSWNYGSDVVVYDVRSKSPFVSYFVVCSAANKERLKALNNAARETLYDNYKTIDHTEGKNDSQWILIDAKDVVVHLFTKEEREHFALDERYQDCPHKVVRAKKEPVYRKKKRRNMAE